MSAPMYVVLAKRPERGRDTFSYEAVSSVRADRDMVENHQAYCQACAEEQPQRYGDVEYVIAKVVLDGAGGCESEADRELRLETFAENGYEAWRMANATGIDPYLPPQWCDVRPNVEEYWLDWARAMVRLDGAE